MNTRDAMIRCTEIRPIEMVSKSTDLRMGATEIPYGNIETVNGMYICYWSIHDLMLGNEIIVPARDFLPKLPTLSC